MSAQEVTDKMSYDSDFDESTDPPKLEVMHIDGDFVIVEKEPYNDHGWILCENPVDVVR